MELIEQLKSLEDIVSRHSSLIEKESRHLMVDNTIDSSEKTKNQIDEIKNNNRLLQIGIVGRVKAGKSSFLNALLFKGKPILPKAATPMTAALTVISYGEKLSAEASFFTEEDIENIKKNADKYEAKFKRLEEEEINKKTKISKNEGDAQQKDTREKIKAKIKMKLRDEPALSAPYDQYQTIKQSGINIANLGSSKIITSDTIESLVNNLGEYVGVDGKYMPFTKSVHISIPQENIKNIQIVDTPGMNDLVTSREEKTRELLKFCDVIFIVSPAGQFISSEDLELMDRITSKEGVRELFVIASKCDMQLYGSVKEKANGDLYKALNAITVDLASHLHSTLLKLKQTNPEIQDAYNKLIEQSKESIIHSSGISLAIKEAYGNLPLEVGEKHAWGKLVEEYPDYFSKSDKKLTIANLDRLSNMEKINKIVSDVRNQKDKILRNREKDFLYYKTNCFRRYKEGLLKSIDVAIENVKSNDIDDLKATRKKLGKIKEEVSGVVDSAYYDSVDNLESNISKKLNYNKLNNYFEEGERDVEGAEGSEKEYYSSWKWLQFDCLSSSVKTVRAGAVKNILNKLTIYIKQSINTTFDECISSWKKDLAKIIIEAVRNEFNEVYDGDLNPNQIKKAIRNVKNNIKLPVLSYKNFGTSDSDLRVSGTLRKDEADNFIEKAQEYITSLREKAMDDIGSHRDSLTSELKNLKISEKIFSEYDAQLEELEKQIENKKVTLDEYGKLKEAIKEVE